MDRFRLRAARPGDADAVSRYHDRCFRDTFAAALRAGAVDVPDIDLDRARFEEWFGPGSTFVTQVAVLDDDTAIGHVTTRADGLVHLFVDPVHQRRGLGTHMLAVGEATIEADGHAAFELHTRVGNDRAVAFYIAAGWTLTDRVIHTVEHGTSYDEHVLVKTTA